MNNVRHLSFLCQQMIKLDFVHQQVRFVLIEIELISILFRFDDSSIQSNELYSTKESQNQTKSIEKVSFLFNSLANRKEICFFYRKKETNQKLNSDKFQSDSDNSGKLFCSLIFTYLIFFKLKIIN